MVVHKCMCQVQQLAHPFKTHHGKHHSKAHGLEEGGKHRHHIPNVDNWHPYEGTTHFELEPAQASGLTIKGLKSFGKVVFATSKLSDKVVIDLTIKTKKVDTEHQVTVVEENGHLTIDSPEAGKLKTYASAQITIPSNIIGTFGLPAFEVDAPKHMVDYSDLPESLEIGDLTIRLAKGFVKAGKVHTNSTQLTVAKGAVRGELTGARFSTNIDVAAGNVIVDVKGSAGSEGTTLIHLGNGALNGTFSVFNSTTLDVAKGSLYSNIVFEESEFRGQLSTKVGSGDSRVYVDEIAGDRSFDASHLTISGSQLLTYPESFEGTIDARGLLGDISVKGDGLEVEKSFGGFTARKGDAERSAVSVKTAKGSIDVLVGEESA